MITVVCALNAKMDHPFPVLGRLLSLQCVILLNLLQAVLLSDEIVPEAVKNHNLNELLAFSFLEEGWS